MTHSERAISERIVLVLRDMFRRELERATADDSGKDKTESQRQFARMRNGWLASMGIRLGKQEVIRELALEIEEVLANLKSDRLQVLEAQLDDKATNAGEIIAKYDQMCDEASELVDQIRKQKDAWVKSDPVAKRWQIAREMAESMIPVSKDRSDSIYNTQAIRSRGMVLAAAMGMTCVGGVPPKPRQDVISSVTEFRTPMQSTSRSVSPENEDFDIPI